MYRTKLVKGWQKALYKFGVDKDILAGLSTEYEVWEVLAHFLTPEFRLDPSNVLGTLLPHRM